MTDRAFAKWVSGMRPLMDIKGEDIKNLIGAMKGVSILVHICESFKEDAVVDDALFILFELCTSPVATEEFIVLGGLQVSVDLLLDEERSGSLHSHTLALLTRVVTSDELKISLIEIGVMPAMIRLVNRTNDKNEVYGRTDRAIVKRSLTLMWMCSSLESIVDYYRSLGEQVVGPLLTLCEIDFDNEVLDMASGLLDKLVSHPAAVAAIRHQKPPAIHHSFYLFFFLPIIPPSRHIHRHTLATHHPVETNSPSHSHVALALHPIEQEARN